MEGGINAEGGERHGHSQHKISWSWDGLKISMWEARTRESKMDQSHNGTQPHMLPVLQGVPYGWTILHRVLYGEMAWECDGGW